MFAEYSGQPGGRGRFLPHVVLVSIDPVLSQATGSRRPLPGQPLRVVVTIHEEGTPLTWRRRVSVPVATEQRLLAQAGDLRLWAARMGMTRKSAVRAAERLGRDLYGAFLGPSGGETLRSLTPTALLLQVDETLVNLPWELMRASSGGAGAGRPGAGLGALALDQPFGRVVTTGTVPRARRDPVAEDPLLRILLVANPTQDLAATEAEVAAIRALDGDRSGATVQVTLLGEAQATVAAFTEAVDGQDFDLIHFAGHASFDPGDPRSSALQLADGPITADAVAGLRWSAPPYVVFNSACESARAGAGRRLVSSRGHSNGLAAAFLAAGTEAYLGHYWPVGDRSAGEFASCFYESLFRQRNIGSAVMEARHNALSRFASDGDLTAFGAVYFGDPGTTERRDAGAMAS